MRLPVNHSLPLAAILLIGAGHAAQARPTSAVSASTPIGPAADYPVIVGEPYVIGNTTWTPSDQLNYDAVGLAGVAEGLAGVAAAHKTLPLPSYAEVTALESGRTILVRLVDRGPKDNETLIALSPAAATQLGITPGARPQVRVRRVNPPEVERAALRGGGTAPMRMETPESLLKVLRRKLAEQSPLMPPPSVPPTMPTSLAAERSLPGNPADKPKATPALASKSGMTKPMPTRLEPAAQTASKSPQLKETKVPAQARLEAQPGPAAPTPTSSRDRATSSSKGTHVVQVAAFSTRERADKAARTLGGAVTQAGRHWRVRLGPFNGGKDATSALEKAKAAGYRDARIQRAD